jgi:hypothetical protein
MYRTATQPPDGLWFGQIMVMWESTGQRMLAIQHRKEAQLRRARAHAAAAMAAEMGYAGRDGGGGGAAPVIVANRGGLDLGSASEADIAAACSQHGLKPRPWANASAAAGGGGSGSPRLRPRVFDVVMLAGPDLELLGVRLRELNSTVDRFVVVEGRRVVMSSSRGNLLAGAEEEPPPRQVHESQAFWRERFGAFREKLVYYRIPESAYYSPPVVGEGPGGGRPPPPPPPTPLHSMAVEGLHRSEMRRALVAAGARRGDIVLAGDAQEIPRRTALGLYVGCEGWAEVLMHGGGGGAAAAAGEGGSPLSTTPPPPSRLATATSTPVVVRLEAKQFAFSFEWAAPYSRSARSCVGELTDDDGSDGTASAAQLMASLLSPHAHGEHDGGAAAAAARRGRGQVALRRQVVLEDGGWACACCYRRLRSFEWCRHPLALRELRRRVVATGEQPDGDDGGGRLSADSRQRHSVGDPRWLRSHPRLVQQAVCGEGEGEGEGAVGRGGGAAPAVIALAGSRGGGRGGGRGRGRGGGAVDALYAKGGARASASTSAAALRRRHSAAGLPQPLQDLAVGKGGSGTTGKEGWRAAPMFLLPGHCLRGDDEPEEEEEAEKGDNQPRSKAPPSPPPPLPPPTPPPPTPLTKAVPTPAAKARAGRPASRPDSAVVVANGSKVGAVGGGTPSAVGLANTSSGGAGGSTPRGA